MHRRYGDRAAFAFVYIAEAHTTDGWQMVANLEDDVLLTNHTTLQERFAAARAAVERLALTLPVLVDGMDDAVSAAFAAWPERIYVFDSEARVAHIGGPGPFEFDRTHRVLRWKRCSSARRSGRRGPRRRGQRSTP